MASLICVLVMHIVRATKRDEARHHHDETRLDRGLTALIEEVTRSHHR